jgi:signal transduction histidine kinase
MAKTKNLAIKISERLLALRWWLMGAISLLVIIVEIDEHQPFYINTLPPDVLREIILFGLVIPLLNGLMLSMLARSRKDKASAERDLVKQYSLSSQLGQVKTWQELIQVIVNFPRTILAITGASLYVTNPRQETYELATTWSRTPSSNLTPSLRIPQKTCQTCELAINIDRQFLVPCNQVDLMEHSPNTRSYCLPLVHRGETVALLMLYFPVDVTITNNHIRQLLGAAPEMAMAIVGARLHQTAIETEEAAEIERKRIARNLHDTLGQNIGYLRLKLDQFSGDDALKEISEIRGELERMREIADIAFVQVRATLADLHDGGNLELGQAMLEYARLAAERSGFETGLIEKGALNELPSHTKRQLLFICRETLNNIEKHAGAGHVTIELVWLENAVSITISDDGRGFDIDSLDLEGHYGLRIMRERASDIGANFQIISEPGSGTQISVWLPLGGESLDSMTFFGTHQSVNSIDTN